MSTDVNTDDPRFAPNAQAFLQCMTCDMAYPPGTERCETCQAQLSSVRRCPNCERVLSSRHEQCIYCAASFLVQHKSALKQQEVVPIKPGAHSEAKQRRATLFGIIIFLITFSAGMTLLYVRERSKAEAPVLATAYAVGSLPLKLAPNVTAPTALTVRSGTVLNIISSAIDDQGRRWFEVKHDSSKFFAPAPEVSPPKTEQKEGGERMLRFWFVSMNDSSQSEEAVKAVNYFCGKYGNTPSCGELRWIAAERIRTLSANSADRHHLQRQARELYEAILSAKGTREKEAAEALASLPQQSALERPSRESGRVGVHGVEGLRQYSLIDRAEVQVQVQDTRSAPVGGTITAPVAREVVINGQVAVPKNATCYLTVLSHDDDAGTVLVNLAAIQIKGRRYNVTTQARSVGKGGALVVFQLDAPLLIGR